LKILVFEYICGGGLTNQVLPDSLAREGRLMLQALLDDLHELTHLQILLPLDPRCPNLRLPPNTQTIHITPTQTILEILPELIAECDAVWPIAPETAGILTAIANLVTGQNKRLLLSPPATIALCSDKLATYQHLTAQQIPCVSTHRLTDPSIPQYKEIVIKPRDACGCQETIKLDNNTQYTQALAAITPAENYLLQPYHAGLAVSLSALFKQGKAWLICCNQQHIQLQDQQFKLNACQVNYPSAFRDYYQELVLRIAETIPALWGYIGIDLLETAEFGPLVLEINPRLTSSYIGIKAATGINVAAEVLALIDGEPILRANRQGKVTVNI
jgi:predicted ATP-grasp superfamily ATP-dependent carboligase